MFNRKNYKKQARQQLNKNLGTPVCISLIFLGISFLFQIPSIISLFLSEDFWTSITMPFSSTPDLMNYSGGLTGFPSFFVSFIQTCVEGIVNYAAITVYLKIVNSNEKATFSDFLEGLTYCGKALLATLWKTLWVFLWSLLFVIPGIIKSLAYSQMFCILGENKNISIRKSMRISTIITRNHKGDLFLMYLSFAGWGLLSLLTSGIGYIFLMPYIKLSMVNAYHGMLNDALKQGIICQEDFE